MVPCLLLTLSVALYAILKPATTANDLWILPSRWAVWLDAHYDLRTLLMTLGVLLPVAGLLAQTAWNRPRRRLLLLVTSVLVMAEFAQLGIATRGFGWPDVGYTVLGGVVAEAVATIWANVWEIGQRKMAGKKEKRKRPGVV